MAYIKRSRRRSGDPSYSGPLHPSGTVRRAYAPKAIANLHGLLFSIFQSAVDADPSPRDSNPCAHTRLSKGDDTED
nr:hypothetical protein OH820_09565 [Streptomyces sp. NBC_00857]